VGGFFRYQGHQDEHMFLPSSPDVAPAPFKFRSMGHALPAVLRLGCLAWLLVATLSADAAVDIFMRIGGQPAAMNSTQTAPQLPGDPSMCNIQAGFPSSA